MEDSRGEIVLYKSEDGNIKVDVLMQNETVWLTQNQMAELFQKSVSTINEHIKNIFEEGELLEDENSLIITGYAGELRSVREQPFCRKSCSNT